jgi:hypothetical protein
MKGSGKRAVPFLVHGSLEVDFERDSSGGLQSSAARL